jgi:hypothetical protein
LSHNKGNPYAALVLFVQTTGLMETNRDKRRGGHFGRPQLTERPSPGRKLL